MDLIQAYFSLIYWIVSLFPTHLFPGGAFTDTYMEDGELIYHHIWVGDFLAVVAILGLLFFSLASYFALEESEDFRGLVGNTVFYSLVCGFVWLIISGLYFAFDLSDVSFPYTDTHTLYFVVIIYIIWIVAMVLLGLTIIVIIISPFLLITSTIYGYRKLKQHIKNWRQKQRERREAERQRAINIREQQIKMQTDYITHRGELEQQEKNNVASLEQKVTALSEQLMHTQDQLSQIEQPEGVNIDENMHEKFCSNCKDKYTPDTIAPCKECSAKTGIRPFFQDYRDSLVDIPIQATIPKDTTNCYECTNYHTPMNDDPCHSCRGRDLFTQVTVLKADKKKENKCMMCGDFTTPLSSQPCKDCFFTTERPSFRLPGKSPEESVPPDVACTKETIKDYFGKQEHMKFRCMNYLERCDGCINQENFWNRLLM